MTTVATGAGLVRGRAAELGLSFLGVPYAAATRWAPPTEVAPWDDIRDATTPGPAAPQPSRPVAAFTHGAMPRTDETACLNLNVFTPSAGGARPVFVWIHGGGFAIGHAAASIYAGERLALDLDAVVVTINYRLGSLGWLVHPGLAADSGAIANWGLLDQIAALHWVRENVSSFGGDSGRVTLAGQSAGALSVLDLLIAPGAEGLFQRAVVQSPPFADVAQALDPGVRWAEALSSAVAGEDSRGFDAEVLRELDANLLVELHEQLLDTPEFRGTRGGALPTLDPATLPRSPAALPAAGPTVDVLAGHTGQEGTFFFRSPWRPAPQPERIPQIVAHLCHSDDPAAIIAERRERAAAHGAATDELSLLVEIATDAMIAAPLADWANARANAVSTAASDAVLGAGSVFRYRVDHPGAGPELGATHSAEVPLLFGSWRDGGPGERLGGQADPTRTRIVARELTNAWGGFVHDGSPGWSSIAEDPQMVRVFG